MRLLISLASACFLINIVNCSDTNYRLNTPIKPISYALSIRPYFDTGDETAFTFDGEVSIRFTTSEATNRIKLHSEDLSFSVENVAVVQSNVGNALMISNLTFEKAYSFVHINLTSELQPRFDYEVKIVYKGPIRNDLNGFYRNYYLEGGVKKWLGATQMEPTHARKAFPCLDEPELKATFTLTIDRPQNYKPSLTNTYMRTSNNLTDGYVRETFYTTPKMSTYLVAFLVSEFEPAHIVEGTREFGVFTRPEAKNQSDYAFEVGLRVVDALISYFAIDYYFIDSNLRLDHVALPDFRAGAMENWGLIKYREALLLYVPEVSTPYYKYRVAQIMAHETTHMWFGNLVTCHWWSNTWLNEGFANYFQDYITALIEPELSSASILVTGSVYAAYDADDAPTSPAITNNNVNSPAEISAHFGTVTYQKAGSVIRMIHHLIGDEAFKYGLNLYLKNNSFNAGYPDKMYAALNDGVLFYNNTLSAYPGVNVTDVMSIWVSQPGHPVLNVHVNHETETVTLSQKRFLINSSHESDEIYKIPITFATEMSPDFENTKPAFIMENKTLEFSIADIGKNHGWVIFNIQETGLYRVNYDLLSWQIIATALKGEDSKKIHHLNRAKIVNDLFAFLYADQISFSILHHVLEFLSTETDYSVWYAALRGLNKLRNSYLGDETLIHIQEYSLRLLESGIKKVGYEVRSADDFETLRNRMQLLEFACKLDHEGCIQYTVGLFRSLRQNGTEISPSLRPVAYCNGLRYGSGGDYEFLWHRMMSTNVASEARTIGDALGCTSDEGKLKSYLVSMLMENSAIRTQDLLVPLTSVLSNYSHLHVVMDGLKENYTLWTTIYPSMDTVLSTVASVLRSEEDFKEFETWLASCSQCGEDVRTAARNTLNLTKASRSWAENHKADILQSINNISLKTVPSAMMIVAGLLVFFTTY